MTDRRKERISFIFSTLLYLLIMAFFVCVVFVYYRKLYNETKDNIITSGRINAIESANQIDKRMSSSLDILKLASYTLDNMIRDKRSRQEILDYLTNETIAVGDSLIADTTGIYGFINGEYMDGSGWDPGEGYDATLRPWYVSAMEGGGKIMIVDPYLDLDTGTVMIAIVKTLCDSKSVVGIDISMSDLQNIVESHVSEGRSSSEFIINSHGLIIAHSDKELIGTGLYNSSDPFLSAISPQIKTSKSGYFYMEHAGKDYMVYSMPLENEWTCVSVIDATEDFAMLAQPLIYTIFTAVIILAVFVVVLMQSESKRKQARELALKSERATAANEAKTSFLSNMSHEIRTPVNAILGMNEMILRETSEETIRGYSENIKSASSSLLGIINDILDFSKIEAGKIDIIPVEYDLSSVINDLVNMIYTRADDKGLALEVNIDRNTPGRLRGDEVRIKQVITNILTNAVKYTEKGTVSFSVGYEQIKDDPGYVLLKVSVKDTGIGIRSEDIEKLFTKFERIEEERNRNIEGTGLGMNITMSLLELMGTTLIVDSEYGKGSTFSFRLRQKVISWEPVGDKVGSYRDHLSDHKKYKVRFTAPNARVLVVDDNPMNITVFISLIKQTLIHIDTAESGDEGIRLAKDNKYDILFLDHMMPKKDGIETLRDIKRMKDGPNAYTPAVCLTANAVSGARDQYIAAGFDDYLTKPIDADRLEEMLIEYLPYNMIEEGKEEEIKPVQSNADAIPDDIASIDGDIISVATGLKNSQTVDIYRTVLKSFYDSIEKQKDELDGSFAREDTENYAIKVHALKSSAKIIGAVAFGEEAQLLEDAAKNNDMDYIRQKHEAFMDEYMMFVPILSKLFAKEEDTSKPVADMALMEEAYDEIKQAAMDMDCSRLENVFEEMKEYRIMPEEKELFDKLSKASADFEYDMIVELLSKRSATE